MANLRRKRRPDAFKFEGGIARLTLNHIRNWRVAFGSLRGSHLEGYKWLDTKPNCSVQYVGLSSWDKHVGYRNVNVLPLTRNHVSLLKHVDCGEYKGEDDMEEHLRNEFGNFDDHKGLGSFLESWELSDVYFLMGEEERAVPAHKVILAAADTFESWLLDQDDIPLKDAIYPILRAFLQFIYTRFTQIPESLLGSLRDLSLRFGATSLVKQSTLWWSSFPSGLPANVQRLEQLYMTGEFSDVDVSFEGRGLIARSHKVILGLWSLPFMKLALSLDENSKQDKIINPNMEKEFAAIKKENESLQLELKASHRELQKCRDNLNSCLEKNEKHCRIQ
ncbi:BTB/Kelch-associated [Artemisia annua]|uniref:BTB/Kelch-associated n=1 Tax=Artemisia annua TaxID=35608 RepID=A0A2U1M5X2_ARTAN|nr:BTB/Kelch-associated [Artemisia annua]